MFCCAFSHFIALPQPASKESSCQPKPRADQILLRIFFVSGSIVRARSYCNDVPFFTASPTSRLSLAFLQVRQVGPQLAGRPEQRVLGGLLGGVQHLADGSQLQSLVMLQLKNGAFARRQLVQGLVDGLAHALAVELARRIGHGPGVGDIRHQVQFVASGIDDCGRIFAAALAAAQVVQAKVGDDPVEPGVERALKPEVSQVAIGLQERLLVDVLGVLLVAQHVQRQAQDRLVETAHQRVERGPVSALRLADEVIIFGALEGARLNLRRGQLPAASFLLGPGLLRRLWHRWGRFYRPQRIRGCAQQRGDTRRRGEPVETSSASAGNGRKRRRQLPAGFQAQSICIHGFRLRSQKNGSSSIDRRGGQKGSGKGRGQSSVIGGQWGRGGLRRLLKKDDSPRLTKGPGLKPLDFAGPLPRPKGRYYSERRQYGFFSNLSRVC